jgi:PHS family inorganic phosphate transporter-like MFS transporter
MLSSVFFFQPLGQLAATLVALVITACFRNSLTAGFRGNPGESSSGDLFTFNCYQDEDCVRTVDIMWRIIIGLGAVPPVLALWFRLAILESPRYTADVLNENLQAFKQISLMGKDVGWRRPSKPVPDSAVTEALSRGRATGFEGAEDPDLMAHGAIQDASVGRRTLVRPISHGDINDAVSNQPTTSAERSQDTADISGIGPKDAVPNIPLGIPAEVVHVSSAGHNGIKHYYWDLGHGWTLFACSLCWFCVDLPF